MLVYGIEWKTAISERLLPRVHAAITREANRAVMRKHAAEHIPQHFATGAEKRYGYTRRRSTINLAFLYRSNRSAWERVRKLTGGIRRNADGTFAKRKRINRGLYEEVKKVLGMGPLEWSGQFRTMATSPLFQKITATQHRAKLLIKTPPWVTSRIKNEPGVRGRQMQHEALRRHAELQAITPGELRTLRVEFKDFYLKEFKKQLAAGNIRRRKARKGN